MALPDLPRSPATRKVRPARKREREREREREEEFFFAFLVEGLLETRRARISAENRGNRWQRSHAQMVIRFLLAAGRVLAIFRSRRPGFRRA